MTGNDENPKDLEASDGFEADMRVFDGFEPDHKPPADDLKADIRALRDKEDANRKSPVRELHRLIRVNEAMIDTMMGELPHGPDISGDPTLYAIRKDGSIVLWPPVDGGEMVDLYVE